MWLMSICGNSYLVWTMDFDERGLITPAYRVRMSHEDFRKAFVETITSHSRSDLYRQFTGYTESFRSVDWGLVHDYQAPSP